MVMISTVNKKSRPRNFKREKANPTNEQESKVPAKLPKMMTIVFNA